MRQVSSKRPSASLIVAVLALIVALGGSAYAATKVGTKDIRKGAVTAGKIRAGAVTTKKIRPGAVGTARLANDAVTGEKVLESSLAPVPWARQANVAGLADRADLAQTALSSKSAEHANTAETAQTAAGFSRYHTTGLVRASVGETVPLATIGPFTVAGACIDVEAPTVVRARTVISTSEPNSFLSSFNANYVGGGFQPGVLAQLGTDIADDEPEWLALNAESMWTAASPDGSVLLQGFANNGVFVFGRDCAFNLTWMENA